MKIKEILEDRIIFDNGNILFYYHEQDCCESVYADFSALDDLAINAEYDEDEFVIKAVADSGFHIRGINGRWFFIPCYSLQNGYYSDEINVGYISKDEIKLVRFNAEFIEF